MYERIPIQLGMTKGSVLVSNFNAKSNLQGTGTTIVQISPDGKTSLFAQVNAATLPGACPGGVGLTTALVVLQRGWVIVGSLPTADGTSATAQADCLIVLNSSGKAVETFSGNEINGPWDIRLVEEYSTSTSIHHKATFSLLHWWHSLWVLRLWHFILPPP